MEIDKMTADELTKITTHKEVCEMLLEMKQNVNHISEQFEKIFTYAKALELEKSALINRLMEIEKK